MVIINTVPRNIKSEAASLPTPSENINTVPEIINSYAQWQYYYCPNKCKPIDSTAVSIYAPSGNINTVTRNINSYAQWLSQYTRPVAILILFQ